MNPYEKVILLLTVAACCIMACTGNQQKKTNMETDNATLVRLETTLGNITVKLYNETPKHRDNFIKLVKEGVYDSLLFHRVIKNFMVQAGDPDSKNANDTASLGYGDVGYTVPAEFNPALFHKKGALAAARQGDDVNPEKPHPAVSSTSSPERNTRRHSLSTWKTRLMKHVWIQLSMFWPANT